MPKWWMLMLSCLLCVPLCVEAERPVPRVRAQGHQASALLEYARTAPTITRLLASVERSHLLVYVVQGDTGFDGDGRIEFVGDLGEYQCARVYVRVQPRHLAAAVLAHELQHAVEVVAAGIRTRAEFGALFRRIGFPVPGVADGYDTVQAVDAGLTTLRELTGRPVRPGLRTARALQALSGRVR